MLYVVTVMCNVFHNIDQTCNKLVSKPQDIGPREDCCMFVCWWRVLRTKLTADLSLA